MVPKFKPGDQCIVKPADWGNPHKWIVGTTVLIIGLNDASQRICPFHGVPHMYYDCETERGEWTIEEELLEKIDPIVHREETTTWDKVPGFNPTKETVDG